jgi:hypothetical protein
MSPSAPTPYRRILLHLAQMLGEVPHTRLHKLVYLIDLEYYRRYGRTLTGAPWVRHNYGPMTKALLPALAEMNGHELNERPKTTLSERTLKLIEPGPAPRFQPDLGAAELEVADFILGLTQRLSDRQVVDLAYATTPIDEPLDFAAAPVLPDRDEPDPEGYAAFKLGEVQALRAVRLRLLNDIAG